MFPLASAQRRHAPRPAGVSGGAFDRAPALKEGAERILVSLVKSLQTMASTTTTVEGALVGFRTMVPADHIAGQRPGAVAATIECAGLPCTLLATLDATLVHAIVELLCGGDGAECRPDDQRPSTAIDAQYAHVVVTLAAGAIAAEWKAQAFGATKPVRLDGAPPLDVCGARIGEVGVLTLALGIFGLRGLLTLALPPAALDAFAAIDADIVGEPPRNETSWTSDLRREVGRASVDVQVLLDALPLSLRELSTLRPGQVLALPSDARVRAALVCDGRTFYRGEIGQDEERYSLRIDEIVGPDLPNPARPSIRDLPRDTAKA